MSVFEETPSQFGGILQEASRYISITHVTLTFRYADWPDWDMNQFRYIPPYIRRNIALPPSVDTFEMEFETRNDLKDELYGMLAKSKTWKLGHKSLSTGELVDEPFQLSEQIESSWIGSSRPGNHELYDEDTPDDHFPEANGTPDLPVEDMKYVIVKQIWTRISTVDGNAT